MKRWTCKKTPFKMEPQSFVKKDTDQLQPHTKPPEAPPSAHSTSAQGKAKVSRGVPPWRFPARPAFPKPVPMGAPTLGIAARSYNKLGPCRPWKAGQNKLSGKQKRNLHNNNVLLYNVEPSVNNKHGYPSTRFDSCTSSRCG